jgi:hypothetical protein
MLVLQPPPPPPPPPPRFRKFLSAERERDDADLDGWLHTRSVCGRCAGPEPFREDLARACAWDGARCRKRVPQGGRGKGWLHRGKKCVLRVNASHDVEVKTAAACRSFDLRHREAVGGAGPGLIDRATEDSPTDISLLRGILDPIALFADNDMSDCSFSCLR